MTYITYVYKICIHYAYKASLFEHKRNKCNSTLFYAPTLFNLQFILGTFPYPFLEIRIINKKKKETNTTASIPLYGLLNLSNYSSVWISIIYSTTLHFIDIWIILKSLSKSE